MNHLDSDSTSIASRFTNVTLLIVDDNDINLRVASALVESEGAKALLAMDGQQALDQLAIHTVDCVLMDVHMPMMDGIATTRQIRANPKLANLPVIALTADWSKEARAQCAAVGMNDFLTKPIMPDLLYEAVARAVNAGKSAPAAVAPPLQRGVADGEIIDLAVLANYLDGNLPRVQGVARMFIASMTKTLQELESSLARQDVSALRALGHRAKSSAATVGALGLMRLCEELQNLAPVDASITQATVIVQKMPPLLGQIATRIDAAFA